MRWSLQTVGVVKAARLDGLENVIPPHSDKGNDWVPTPHTEGRNAVEHSERSAELCGWAVVKNEAPRGIVIRSNRLNIPTAINIHLHLANLRLCRKRFDASRIDKPAPIGRRVSSVTLQRIMLSAGLLALTGMGLFPPSVARAQTNRAPRARNTPQRKLSARQIAQRTGPSVVLLVTTDEGGNPIALGSGFFIQSNVIATANHVIKDAPQIYAKIAGRRARHKISFIGSSDEKNDLALLRIDDVKGQPLKLGNLSRLRVGDEIYVMGNPEGLEGTFSRGNISAIRNREGLIQITAPISHGSSGGPVLDERGEVIGVAQPCSQKGRI